MVAKSAYALTAVLAIAVSVIPSFPRVLFESEPPVGPYRRLLNSVLVVVRLCIIPVAVVVSPSRRLDSSPRRLVTSSPRRLVASSLLCLIATSLASAVCSPASLPPR